MLGYHPLGAVPLGALVGRAAFNLTYDDTISFAVTSSDAYANTAIFASAASAAATLVVTNPNTLTMPAVYPEGMTLNIRQAGSVDYDAWVVIEPRLTDWAVL